MSCHVVIVGDVQVKGLNGTKRWFLNQEPYCYTRKVRLLVSCDECNQNASNHLAWYYEIIIDNETFRVPLQNIVEVAEPIMMDPVKFGTGESEEYVYKRIYEDVNKDEDYPSNGDYQGYMQKKLGLVQSNKADYSGDSWYEEQIKRQRGLPNGNTQSED